MVKKMNKLLGVTNNSTISKASQRKLRRSRKPKELGKPKQYKIGKLREELGLLLVHLEEIKASGQPLEVFALMSEISAKNQRLEQLMSVANALILDDDNKKKDKSPKRILDINRQISKVTEELLDLLGTKTKAGDQFKTKEIRAKKHLLKKLMSEANALILDHLKALG